MEQSGRGQVLDRWGRLATRAAATRAVAPALVVDAALLTAALVVPMLLRFSADVPRDRWRPFLVFLAIAIVVVLAANAVSGLYSQVWRHASIVEARMLARTAVLATLVLAAILISNRLAPLSVLVFGMTLYTMFSGAFRFQSRLFALRRRQASAVVPSIAPVRVLIVGAGSAGALLIRQMREDGGYLPVALLDDDPRLHGRQLLRVKVLGAVDDLPRIAATAHAEQVLVAVANADGALVRRVSDLAEQAGLAVRVLPTLRERVTSSLGLSQVRELRIEDLLGRNPVDTDLAAVRRLVTGRRVLVTGAGGSIGGEIARQIAQLDPAELILLDHDETHLYDVCWTVEGPVTQVLADIRQRALINQVFAEHRPEVVFHAAAHKHVPLLEDHPAEAIKTNVTGTDNLVSAALAVGTERFVFISTDKAVRPSSVMGATKRLGEHLVLSSATRGSVFCAVRFGNVLGSRGSVIPTFTQQIAQGGPVTVTDPRMTRFFMTIPEAVQLVLQAAALSTGGEVFMLEMGQPVAIRGLAERLIRMQGHRVGTDIEVRYTGIRPGEKLTEELHTPEEEPHRTPHPSIVRLNPVPLASDTLGKAVSALGYLTDLARTQEARTLLFHLADAELDDADQELLGLRHRRRSEDGAEEDLTTHHGVALPARRASDIPRLLDSTSPEGDQTWREQVPHPA
ncbi:MAG: polysaccharide biosynthesis protein [Actinomycetes bacterium]